MDNKVGGFVGNKVEDYDGNKVGDYGDKGEKQVQFRKQVHF